MESKLCLGCELVIPTHCRRCKRPFASRRAEELAGEILVLRRELEAERSKAAPQLFPEVLPTIQEWKQVLIDESIRRTGGDKRTAAKLLGIGATTIYRRTL
jgi:DNA-binding NtrC family response regulator